jgi:hypothetical protein
MATSRTGYIRSGTVVVVVAAAVGGFLAWRADRAGVSPESRSIADCRHQYSQARTFNDTTAVDLKYPKAYWEQAGRGGPRTCGELRTEGRLR